MPLYFLIELAYGDDWGRFGFRNLRRDQLVGGPSWIWSEGYDIQAKVQDSLAEKFGKGCGPAFYQGSCGYRHEMILMLQSLLADRFKLRVRREVKKGHVYALVVAKGGAKFLHTAPPPLESAAMAEGSTPPAAHRAPCPAGMGCIEAYTSMGLLANVLSGVPEIGRPVIDETGLKGGYYIKLQTPRGTGGRLTALPGSSGPSIFTALREQLGLKLRATKGPVETLVIDHVERPSEN